MALIRCTECKAKVSEKADACPKCGAPVEKSGKKQKKQISTGCGCLIVILVIGGLIMAISVVNQDTDSRPRTTTGKLDASEAGINLLPGVRSFLRTHDDFGTPSATETIPDWAQGKRQRVRFTNGRSLLFYLKDGKVITVYQDDAEEGRTKVWGSGSTSTAEYMTDVSRTSEGSIPDYTIISAINLLAGGKHADVLIPSLSQRTPIERRREIAFEIRKKEGLRTLSMYSTNEAYKAAYSSSFAEQHPKASQGFLGSIALESGEFQE